MNKRSIYKNISIGKLQQGYIFNQAISEDYKESDVYGVIITPRCDIENKKVTTLHYLPIISLKEWLLNDYWYILRSMLKKDLEQSINNIFKQNNISTNLIGTFELNQIKDKFINQISTKQKDKEKFSDLIDWLVKINEVESVVSKDFLQKIHKNKSFKKIGQNILKEIVQNNRKEFYLLEDWNGSTNYYVVLLREIQKLEWDLGVKISKGIHNEEISLDYFRNNDIKNKKDGFISPIKAIKSPFIEHLIQKFFTNFGKVGILDHEKKLELELLQNNIFI